MSAVSAVKERRAVAMAGALAVVSVGLYTTVILAPLVRHWMMVSRQVHDAREQLARVELDTANTRALNEQHRQLTHTIRSWRTRLPTDDELPAILTHLSRLATQTNLTVQAIRPVRAAEELTPPPAPGSQPPSTTEAIYHEALIHVETLGGYHELGAWLSLLESDPTPMTVTSLHVADDPKDARRHQVAVVIRSYLATHALAAEVPSLSASDASAEPLASGEGVFQYPVGGRRDPFVALVRDGRVVGAGLAGALGFSQPVLYGILWDSSGASIALLNGEEVTVGETIGEYHVVEIREDAVVLMHRGEPVVLQMGGETPAPAQPLSGTRGGDGS